MAAIDPSPDSTGTAWPGPGHVLAIGRWQERVWLSLQDVLAASNE
jgi:hypothetical protein